MFVNSYGQPEGCQRDKCDFYVDWRRNGEFIDFRMEGDGSGWIAMGITADNLTLNAVSNALYCVHNTHTSYTTPSYCYYYMYAL